jgi:hypothetical protein
LLLCHHAHKFIAEVLFDLGQLGRIGFGRTRVTGFLCSMLCQVRFGFGTHQAPAVPTGLAFSAVDSTIRYAFRTLFQQGESLGKQPHL